MNEIEIGRALLSTCSLMGAAYFFFRLYPRLRVDEFRQKIFRLRDEMFDAAHRGEVSFDDQAYKTLRAVMNGFISDAERVTMLDLTYCVVKHRELPKEEQNDVFAQAFSAASAERRAIYARYRKNMSWLVLDLVVRRSLILYSVGRIFELKDLLGRKLNSALGVADFHAYQVGSGCLPAH